MFLPWVWLHDIILGLIFSAINQEMKQSSADEHGTEVHVLNSLTEKNNKFLYHVFDRKIVSFLVSWMRKFTTEKKKKKQMES